MPLTLPLIAVIAGCGGGASNSSAGHPAAPKTVTIADFKFGAPVTVPVGTKVTWVNRDRAPHTATGTGFDTGTLTRGQRASHVFAKAGTYAYVCQLHPFMRGTVIVR